MASEAGLPLLQQAIAGSGAGIVGGVADRAISTGSMNTATESLGDIGHDAVLGAAAVLVQRGVTRAVEKSGSKGLTQAVKEMNRKGSVKGKAKAAVKVDAEKAAVAKNVEVAGETVKAVTEVVEKVTEKKPEKVEGPMNTPDPNQRH